MGLLTTMIGLTLLGQPGPGSAADSVTLRDGKVVLGQILESDRRGPLLILVRRDWATNHLPEKLAAWEKAERPINVRAAALRRERLLDWLRERRAANGAAERITPWLDRETARLADPKVPLDSPLLVARLARSEVTAIDRKPRRLGSMLRLGWLSGFGEVEAMKPDDLTQALEARGFATTEDRVVSVDELLPIPLETDARWLTRRAATEVANDPGGRFLRYQGMLILEPAAGEAPPLAASLDAALGSLKDLLGEAPTDPLPGKLQELARQGRVGAIVTRLEMAADFSSSSVETTLWVRLGDRWSPAVARSGSARTDQALVNNADQGLAEDPQVQAAFRMVETLGLGVVPPELKRQSLAMGAATRGALNQARRALDGEIQSLALPLEAVRPGR